MGFSNILPETIKINSYLDYYILRYYGFFDGRVDNVIRQ